MSESMKQLEQNIQIVNAMVDPIVAGIEKSREELDHI